MRLANQVSELDRLGGEVVLASVDPPQAQLAMNRLWHLPFRWVSDPEGERLAKPLDAWNPSERGGLFQPLVLLVAPDGRELVRHHSRDFADRANDDDALQALRDLQLPSRRSPSHWRPAQLEPVPTESAFRPEAFGPYFRGIRMNAQALTARMRDPRDRAELEQTEAMAKSFLEAWKQRREARI